MNGQPQTRSKLEENNMKLLLLLLALALISLISPSALALQDVPGDLNGDQVVSDEEFGNAEEARQKGQISSQDLDAIRHIHDRYPRTITDTRGRNVTIYQPVKTVVCTVSHHLETLRTLGVPSEIVVAAPENIDIYSLYPEYKDSPTVGDFYEPDVEKIIEFYPDLVLVHPGSGTGTFGAYIIPLLETLEDAGLTVACFACSRPEVYTDEVRKLGVVFEWEYEAEVFVEFYQQVLDSIENRVKDVPEDQKSLVYSEYQPYRASENDVSPIEAAGGRSIYAGCGAVGEVNPEDVVPPIPMS
jgi:iron complex transport system substrate-binding protein